MKSHTRNVSSLRFLTLSLTLAVAAPLAAQRDWVDHQAARLVIGQPSFTRQNPASSRDAIGSAGGVAVAGNKLFIAEGNRIGATPINNRVLIYNNLSGFIPAIEAVPPQEKTCPVCVGTADVVLGQPNFETLPNPDPEVPRPAPSQANLYAPSGIASDGNVLAVADTNHNRVLIWQSVPTNNSTPPNVVVGQPDFTTTTPGTSAQKMRGPQGVWIDSGRLFVADTQNSRILIYNSIPTSNGASPNVVVGQPDFDTRPEVDLTQQDYPPTAARMLDPISVTVNNGRMFVADLGFDRVLIFFSIPTQNGFPADVVIGQKDMETTGFSDHDDNILTPQVRTAVLDMCDQIGPFDDDGSFTPNDDIFPDPIDRDPNPDLDGDGEPDDEPPPLRWPRRCENTLNFPRFALSDGEKLFVADSGNDRILVYNQIPTQNGAPADVVIGQPDFIALTDSVGPGNLRSPTSLAHDGTNLYVADPFVRRVLVFSPADPIVYKEGVVNGASFAVKATGWVEYSGATTDDGQLIKLTISARPYELRTAKGETGESVRDKLIAMINADADRLVDARPFNGPGFFARAQIKFGGSVRAGDVIRLTIGAKSYELTTFADDVPLGMVDRFNFIIDADPHPLVTVDRDPADVATLLITARDAGPAANSIGLSVGIPSGSPLTAELANPNTDVSSEVGSLAGGSFPYRIRLTAIEEGRPGNGVTIANEVGGAGVTGATSGGRLTAGSDARMLPNGSFASIFGEELAGETLYASLNAEGMLPTELGGVQVFVNGQATPIYAVSPNQVNIQVPWEIEGIGSSTYVRRVMPDGSVTVSAPRANETARAAPGIFAYAGNEPRRAVALHGQAQAQGTIGIAAGTSSTSENSETVNAGATVTITVNGRNYTYTTQSGDTLESVRDRLIEAINAGNGDPEVVATAGREGFFSARADVDFTGEPVAGDTVTITVADREYTYEVQEGDTLAVIRNVLVNNINAGQGDPDVTARRLELVGAVVMQVVARSLGVEGNDIVFAVERTGTGVQVETNVEEGHLEGGQTPPVVTLTARVAGREANAITYSASTSDAAIVGATARTTTLCCGNVPFSLITDENPAIPGEIIIIYASGLGFTEVKPQDQGIESGEITPALPDPKPIQVPFIADDFVSALAGGRTAQIRYAGLAPGLVGVYQVNLQLNEQLPDDPETPLTIAQVLFISNTVTIPVKNLIQRDPDTL
jgi:uncharacterized protein (TIGR03437 family)